MWIIMQKGLSHLRISGCMISINRKFYFKSDLFINIFNNIYYIIIKWDKANSRNRIIMQLRRSRNHMLEKEVIWNILLVAPSKKNVKKMNRSERNYHVENTNITKSINKSIEAQILQKASDGIYQFNIFKLDQHSKQ